MANEGLIRGVPMSGGPIAAVKEYGPGDQDHAGAIIAAINAFSGTSSTEILVDAAGYSNFVVALVFDVTGGTPTAGDYDVHIDLLTKDNVNVVPQFTLTNITSPDPNADETHTYRFGGGITPETTNGTMAASPSTWTNYFNCVGLMKITVEIVTAYTGGGTTAMTVTPYILMST